MNIQFHKTIVTLVTENSYRIADEDLGTLLKTKRAAGQVDAKLGDDVFRVLLRRVKDAENSGTDTTEAFEAANKRVLEVAGETLIGDDIRADKSDSPEEKARKTKARGAATGFIRSAASVLRKYIKREGTVSALDPEVHGKAAVQALNDAASEGTESVKSTAERVSDRLNRLLKSLRDMHGEDAGKALEAHDLCIKAIEEQRNMLA